MSDRGIMHTCVLILCLLALSAASARTSPAGMVKMALHIDTRAGGGRYSVHEIARFLEEEGIDGAVITDHDNARITYGLFPLRNILKRTLSFPSIEEYGAGAYVADIRAASRRYPDLILIPGAEAVPFYYWEGNPLTGDLTLKGWQRHVLVVGLDEARDFENLPALHRGFGDRSGIRVSLLLMSAGMAAAGVYMARKRIKKKFRFDRLSYTVVSTWPRVPGLIVLGVSLLFLAEAYPFRRSSIDQYHGDQGALPYQKLIDHANSLGALTFWAHPEAAVRGEYEGVAYETSPYHHLLLETKGYDGFAIFWSGDREAGGIGGAWDTALGEYARGEREKPVWAVGELDWEGENGKDLIGETLTLCFPEERSARGVLSAMRSGKMVAVRGSLGKDLAALDFFVATEAGDTARLGETMSARGPFLIVFKMTSSGDRSIPGEVSLIRNGSLLTASRMDEGGDWVYRETEVPGPGEVWYYRVAVGDGFPLVATNPVFVRGSARSEGKGGGRSAPSGKGGSA